ncbi:MAG: quinolinate synthase NadA [Lentisphaeria bacterium]|jgi:quinolinate synthase
MEELVAKINRLRRERKAVILAHTYQTGDIQDIADYVGDSYGLSVKASQVRDAEAIIFCGVQFMAETAAILNPGRKVIMPDPSAGCPMADMITAEQLRAFKAAHPGAPVVCYVNSTAEVKAESDICCTSANAAKIVRSLGEVPDILFIPDQFLGKFVEKQLGRNLTLWPGFCPTHNMIRAETVLRMKAEHPDAKLMVHPETRPEVQELADFILSTGQMAEMVKTTPHRKFIVGTEDGILHTLRKAAPRIEFVLLSPFLRCPNMKKTTLAKVARSLETLETVIQVPEAVAAKAKRAIDAMLRIAATGG